jgi:hypothetical protein
MKWTDEQTEFLIKNYSNKGPAFCAENIGKKSATIVQRAIKLGIKVDKKVVSKLISSGIKKSESNREYDSYNVNPGIFLNIKTKEVAYLLGLIWADGNVSFANNASKTPIIKHNAIEEDNQFFLPIFKNTGDWHSFTNLNEKAIGNKPISTNWTCNRIIGEFLIENDYRDKNKSPDKILSLIPENLKHYFYRGFFDGDGSISVGHSKNGNLYRSLSFSASKNQDWSFIENLLDDLNIKYKIRKLKDDLGESSQIYFFNKHDIMLFFNYINKNNDYENMGLKRKFDKFIKLKSYII